VLHLVRDKHHKALPFLSTKQRLASIRECFVLECDKAERCPGLAERHRLQRWHRLGLAECCLRYSTKFCSSIQAMVRGSRSSLEPKPVTRPNAKPRILWVNPLIAPASLNSSLRCYSFCNLDLLQSPLQDYCSSATFEYCGIPFSE
jgi:hypothetical protein